MTKTTRVAMRNAAMIALGLVSVLVAVIRQGGKPHSAVDTPARDARSRDGLAQSGVSSSSNRPARPRPSSPSSPVRVPLHALDGARQGILYACACRSSFAPGSLLKHTCLLACTAQCSPPSASSLGEWRNLVPSLLLVANPGTPPCAPVYGVHACVPCCCSISISLHLTSNHGTGPVGL